MKKAPFFILILFAFAGFGFNASPADNCSDDNLLCSTTILSGCVGACGSSFSGSVTAPVTGWYCFDAASSLCPTDGAKTVLEVGSSTLFNGDTSGGLSFSFYASAGQNITLRAGLFAKKTNIVCVWLGEVNFTIQRP